MTIEIGARYREKDKRVADRVVIVLRIERDGPDAYVIAESTLRSGRTRETRIRRDVFVKRWTVVREDVP